jgi:subtilisin family serine protease
MAPLRRLALLPLLLWLAGPMQPPARAQGGRISIPPDEVPRQRAQSSGQVLLVQAAQFIHVPEARIEFAVTGDGQTAAVVDTGLRVTHVDFHGRVKALRNFTGGDPMDVTDGHGHGTNVAGVIGARKARKKATDPAGEHEGVAPDARLVALKVFDNSGNGDFAHVADALEWVVKNHKAHGITAVNVSISDGLNHVSDAAFATNRLRAAVVALKKRNIPVVIAAGNEFHTHGSKQGMSYPAILRDAVSVGAFYDADVGKQEYGSGGRGAVATKTAAGRLTPFSQRLHQAANGLPSGALPALLRTDIFAPGAVMTSSGVDNDRGESDQQGTSQAAPMTTGVILLLQEYYRKTVKTQKLPTVQQLTEWLRAGAVAEKDDYGSDDNVANTGLEFPRLDARAALAAAHKTLAAR